MIRFDNDYAEGAHPFILQKLLETNTIQTAGYSLDPFCEQARLRIQQACKDEQADVHFLVGGTQTNLTIISSILRPYQGVIAANSGHIAVNETGAIEATGHHVITVPGHEGKITAAQIQQVYDKHYSNGGREHQVQPGLVYISFPTEFGTLYTKDELLAISTVCRACELPLMIDGARLGYGLMAETNDVTLADLTALSDIYYIGGTKIGAMFGEAVVCTNETLTKDFRYMIKQKGALLAKGRFLGIQFDTLFTNNLYFNISKHAVEMAMQLRGAFEQKNIRFLYDSMTNQQFPILPNSLLEEIRKNFTCSTWEHIDEQHTAVRFCTSWATTQEQIDQLIAVIQAYKS